MNAIETNNLSVGYGEKQIIRDLNIEIPEGKITVILGANGSGKSTMLKTIGRILTPSKGSVLLEGEELYRISSKQVAHRLAILPQSPKAPQGLTVFDLVRYGRFPYQRGIGALITPEDEKIIMWALNVTRLTDLSTEHIENLSGGQRQRVWIAMALAQQTRIILLDEPTTYLDISYQLEIMELLDRLNKEQHYTIVMVLHDLNLSARFADHIVVMNAGEVICSGSPEQVMTADTLRKAFHIEADIVEDKRTGKLCCISYHLLPETDTD